MRAVSRTAYSTKAEIAEADKRNIMNTAAASPDPQSVVFPLESKQKNPMRLASLSSANITQNNGVHIIDLTDDDAKSPCVVPSSAANSPVALSPPQSATKNTQPVLVDLTNDDDDKKNNDNANVINVNVNHDSAIQMADFEDFIEKCYPNTTNVTAQLAEDFSRSPLLISAATSTFSTQLQPQPRSFICFLHKMLDENWRWANQQENMQMRLFYRSQITDFLNGRIQPEEYIRNIHIDEVLSPWDLVSVLKYALEIWQNQRGNREISVDEFLQMPFQSKVPPLLSYLASSITSIQQASSSSIAPSNSIDSPFPASSFCFSNSSYSSQSSQSYVTASSQESCQEPRIKKLKLDDEKAQDQIGKLQLELDLIRSVNEQLQQQFEEKSKELEKLAKITNETFVGSFIKAVCPVCLENLTQFNQEEIKITPCKHVLCARCLEGCRYLRKYSCPVCRTKFQRAKVIHNIHPSFNE